MELTYRIDTEDLVSFNEYYVKNSPLHQHALKQSRWSILLGMLCVAVVLYLSLRDLFISIVIVAISIYIYCDFPRIYLNKIRNSVRCTYDSSGSPLAGVRRIVLTESELQEESSISRTIYQLENVLEIVKTDERFFLLTSSMSGIVIPFRKIESGDVMEFIDQLERYRKRAGCESGTRQSGTPPEQLP